MEKNKQLNTLFGKWKKRYGSNEGFAPDGIINEDLFEKATIKILFLTKEPNNPKQDLGDFREWWQEEMKYAFTLRVAEWAYGFLHNFPTYDSMWEHPEKVHEALKNIAFMNIKKSGGTGNSHENTILEYLQRDADLIQKQIEIIAPEIVITGISWKSVRNTLFPDITWQNSGYAIAIGKTNGMKIIDFYHPSSRNAPAAAYSLMQNVFRSKPFKNL